MKQFFIFVKKETFHILRDKRTLFILLCMPLAQILIFGFALTNEVKNAKICILDGAKDTYSSQLIQKIEASNYFDTYSYINHPDDIDAVFRANKAKIAIVIPAHFESDLQHQHHAAIQIIADAADPNTATTLSNYMSAIIGDYQSEIMSMDKLPMTISPQVRMMYNPQLKGVYNFVPGVMAMILLLVCTLMTSVSIVREKELGTMEILLASPVKPFIIILSKASPYLILSMFNICTILLLSVYVFGMPIQGSLALLFLCSFIFILTALILGLVISTVTDSQMTAMFISMVGMFLPTIMLSGFMFPIENMPLPLRIISNIVPAKYYYIIVKNIMIKGLGLSSILRELGILLFMIFVLTIIAIRKFKIRLQ